MKRRRFKDRLKVHASSDGTLYVDPVEARLLDMDLDKLIRERLALLPEEDDNE